MKKKVIYIDGVKKEIVEKLDKEYYEDAEFDDEDTLDLTNTIMNLDNTLELKRNDLNGEDK